MTATTTSAHARRALARTAVDLEDIEMTLTLGEWHLHRDTPDDTRVVTPHQQLLDLAA